MRFHLPQDHRPTWFVVLGLTVLGLALVVASLVLGSGEGEGSQADHASDVPASFSPSPGVIIDEEAGPDAIRVPSLGLDAPVIPIEIDVAGELSPPGDTDMVGWWQRSAEPGSTKGQTIVTGHTVHTGGGVMNDIGEVDLGSKVEVRDEGKVYEYETIGVFKLSKADVAAGAERIFAQDVGSGRLMMISCSDYVDGEYLTNTFVYAKPMYN